VNTNSEAAFHVNGYIDEASAASHRSLFIAMTHPDRHIIPKTVLFAGKSPPEWKRLRSSNRRER
jgi:hypothetical protein